MEYILLALLLIVLVLLLMLLLRPQQQIDTQVIADSVSKDQSQLRQEINSNLMSQIGTLSQTLNAAQESASKAQRENLKDISNHFQQLRQEVTENLENVRKSVDDRLRDIQQSVDEKLQKTLEDKMTNSFKMVSERLEQVYKGLGEMQHIASSVGDLKKVLSNTKTRGIVGEIQLDAILQEILTPDQYDKEVATRPGSSERVEFAIKLPGNEAGGSVYLPIDAKFPGETYAALQDAYMGGDKTQIDLAYKNLEIFIKQSAKSIREKYVEPPYTTNFAILFLPFEGLYAEVVNRNLIEVLQREYAVNIAGPSTMAAMLNALQMGFRTLQIQKRSDEVWKTLSAVKTEFETFGAVFKKAQDRIKQLDQEMDKLVGTRSRAIERKLRSVQSIELDQADRIIDINGNDLALDE
ncbi:MAG: DNA recombination protein RmuC [Bacteroidales bacterium]|nr:DNA recombination protein RmuC [Bacteroidales bacterium]MBO5915497.1 DNA recombination protein RmuC [Bacteroidales bacterium]MBO5977342.1 DNA recombination protein RmuC [Bacteroidales bacterium]MBO7324448.1 DNA recombination protein RmuC [Bacteroidales bacterium]MBR0453423.1 DNA recombination protein RmuC [Bacteroidales bacterium]